MDKRDKFKLEGNTIAGTFRVDQVVAEGGFGIVYRAFHLHFRSPVALKCLKIPGELSEEDRKQFLEQFRSEAEIQFRLSAALPNIVRPLHVDAVRTESGDFIPIMALEWLEGLSFETIIERRTFSDQPPMPLREAIELIGPAAHALHQAHNFEVQGEKLAVIHRDIKPDNLFLTEINGKKVVKILDFGISRVRRAATQLAGHFSQTAGTAPFSPAYGAPEQWVPKRFGQTGPWTDVWGLALTLVEIIKGDAVIVGDHQAMMGTALDPKVRPSPRSEGVAVSDEVESVFLKALSLDPRFRYQSIEAFWEALQAAAYLSGDEAQDYEETPSGSRIALPRMSAPTPWECPSLDLFESKPVGSLPPMLAPAVLVPTTVEDSEVEAHGEASYPINPHSDLQPVPAAPTNWSHFDPEIPPSSGEPDHLAERAGASTLPRPSEETFAPEPLFEIEETREPSIKLELAATSTYPKNVDGDHPIVASVPKAPRSAPPPPMAAHTTPVLDLPDDPEEPEEPEEAKPQRAPPRVSRPPPTMRRMVDLAPSDAEIPDLGTPPPPARSKRPPPPQRGASQAASVKTTGGPPTPPSRSKRPAPPARTAAPPARTAAPPARKPAPPARKPAPPARKPAPPARKPAPPSNKSNDRDDELALSLITRKSRHSLG